MIVARNNSNYILEIAGAYSSLTWASNHQTDAIVSWCGFYNSTNTTLRPIQINRHSGGSFDYKNTAICITRFA